MWPFSNSSKKAVVVLHIDHDGHARGAWFRGNADVLIIDERDPSNRVYRMASETPDEELLRKIGKHPLGRTLSDKPSGAQRPTLNLHWPIDGPQTA
jgi:hypothetical protein